MATIPDLPFSGQALKTVLDNVNTEVGGKAASSHTHTLSQVTDAGTAAASDASDFATAAQGAAADSALQPGDVNGIPEGGTSGQLLAKASGTDYDVEWIAAPSGSGLVDSVNGQTGAVVLDPDDLDDSGSTHKFATAAQLAEIGTAVQPGDLAAVATSGAYNDLSGRPTLGTAANNDEGNFATAAQGALANSAVQPAAISDMVVSDTTQAGGGSQVTNIVAISQSAYDALATPDASTIYFVTEG